MNLAESFISKLIWQILHSLAENLFFSFVKMLARGCFFTENGWRQNKRDLFFCNKEIEFIRLQKGIKIVKTFGRETNYSSIVIWTSSSRQIARIELNPAVLMQIDVAGFIRQRLVNHCSTVCTIMVFVEKSIDEQENQAFSSPFFSFSLHSCYIFFSLSLWRAKKTRSLVSVFWRSCWAGL